MVIKFITNFCSLNVPEDGIECENLQAYLDNWTYKIVSKQMADYLDENLFAD